MPLSEEEQRILHEIEQQFYIHDRGLARSIEQTTLTRHLARNCRIAAVGFIVGLAVLVASFAFSWILGVAGFVIMLVSAVVFVQNIRRIGRHGWETISKRLHSDGGYSWGEAKEKFRRRFGND